MDSIIYLRLIGLTAGTLLPLFWMVVILGYRRQRNFERVFFFLCTSLFLFYSGSLLAANAQIHYGEPPPGLREFVVGLISLGLCAFPALLMHLHAEYAETRGMLHDKRWKWAVLLFFYAAAFHMATHQFPRIGAPGFDFVLPGDTLPNGYPHVFTYSLLWCTTWEFRFWRNTRKGPERQFYGFLTLLFAVAAVWIIGLYDFPVNLPVATRQWLGAVLATLPVVPLSVMIYLVWRHNFLQIGRQKNLVYAVSATFLALLYLSLVRRVSGWMEPVIPPEASASILLFVLVPFIEPLQRALGRTLQKTAEKGLEESRRIAAELQAMARQGDLLSLLRAIERRVKEQFDLRNAKLVVVEPNLGAEFAANSMPSGGELFPIASPGRLNAALTVWPHGAMLSGDAHAALEFLCEQLPASIELCRSIEEKLQLERELAERERLAVLGQMAASISHNLKNPLGSIKTILQVQMENPELPVSMRGETKMVLDEIGRLSAKLSQLLQFSRPTVRGGSVRSTCDVRTVIEEVVGVLGREAERRGIALQTKLPKEELIVAAAADAVSDVVSNLVVNALEAVSHGGRVSVRANVLDGMGVVTVEDDGTGVSAVVREKILQPFFTTKTQGTGLGLAIVARRVSEFRGQLDWKSPARDGKGSEFRVLIPLEAKRREAGEIAAVPNETRKA
jgi:signal transduction histidine kinase